MTGTFKWDGMKELREALRQLPAEALAEALTLAERAASTAAADIRAEYAQHVLTGTLRDGVFVAKREAGSHRAFYEVKSTSPLAHLFDYGSQARHYVTKANGVQHLTGAMPASHVFVRTCARERRQMYDALMQMLVRHGLVVSGSAAA